MQLILSLLSSLALLSPLSCLCARVLIAQMSSLGYLALFLLVLTVVFWPSYPLFSAQADLFQLSIPAYFGLAV
jgi:hypothetical protein